MKSTRWQKRSRRHHPNVPTCVTTFTPRRGCGPPWASLPPSLTLHPFCSRTTTSRWTRVVALLLPPRVYFLLISSFLAANIPPLIWLLSHGSPLSPLSLSLAVTLSSPLLICTLSSALSSVWRQRGEGEQLQPPGLVRKDNTLNSGSRPLSWYVI